MLEVMEKRVKLCGRERGRGRERKTKEREEKLYGGILIRLNIKIEKESKNGKELRANKKARC